MNSTYKEQINAIQQVREVISRIRNNYSHAAAQQKIELPPILKISNAALNDAASTIAAINITHTIQEHQVFIDLLKKVFLGNGNVNFDGQIIQQINKTLNPE